MAENENIYENNKPDENVMLDATNPFDASLKIYQNINNAFCGRIVDLKKNYAKTSIKLSGDMRYDDDGLAHSSFIFLAADYAAQAAVNLPYLVTIGSKVSFFAPAKIGDTIELEANAFFEESKKREVKVIGKIKEIKIFEGNFQIVVLEDHILKLQKQALETQATKRESKSD
ncbi:PaaI family thioesterase [Campylobacter hyointestinalis]|uniref:PaaI family thioesterase n=1 Tax=Campylobacter hyointestinalis TaxID=198 RepID=UPI000CE4CB9B|nr:PaaI family thioesterase [Campylobacter hyointestinalis]MDL2346572.1 PaaI family thioesterase [Campylobacter hyointestinalis]MDL2348817.1 PaaI family thioesterase [Campylobacter hyointestinalis]MDL2350057.1 PaaI family thioesterase [Campylobacter hyointestinalis]MDM1026394.1 PaaI family thioesterase [Campylobacter hyointestinalis]MDM1027568.1 PaaI family thioesterase [Campylobacter hyointestinalis]